jgi:hypothetical protein
MNIDDAPEFKSGVWFPMARNALILKGLHGKKKLKISIDPDMPLC